MSADFSELMALSADLDQAPAKVAKNLGKALGVTSKKVKNAARSTVQNRSGFGHAAAAIDYEVSEDTGGMSSEIGYDKGKPAGSLGNLIEFGAPNAKAHMLVNGRNVPVPGSPARPLAPSHDLGNALLNNEDDFVHGVEKAVSDSLVEVGL